MNWDAIGAIAELLGAIGVIASLVYLATQIRHGQEQMDRNTRALRASTYQQFNQDLYTRMTTALNVPGLSDTVISGFGGFDQLDDKDAFQFAFWLIGVMEGFDNAMYQYRMEMLDSDRWEKHRVDIGRLLANPGVAEWWRSERGIHNNFSLEFVTLVEEILGEETEGTDGPQS
jgi:hypothetical protein